MNNRENWIWCMWELSTLSLKLSSKLKSIKINISLDIKVGYSCLKISLLIMTYLTQYSIFHFLNFLLETFPD